MLQDVGHTHRCQLAFKKKSPSPESCVPETGSDPPIGSDRDSGRDSVGMLVAMFGYFGYSVN